MPMPARLDASPGYSPSRRLRVSELVRSAPACPPSADAARRLSRGPRPPPGIHWHRQLTENLGVRALVSRCYEVVGMAKDCTNMRELREKVARHYGRRMVQFSLSLPMPDPKQESARLLCLHHLLNPDRQRRGAVRPNRIALRAPPNWKTIGRRGGIGGQPRADKPDDAAPADKDAKFVVSIFHRASCRGRFRFVRARANRDEGLPGGPLGRSRSLMQPSPRPRAGSCEAWLYRGEDD